MAERRRLSLLCSRIRTQQLPLSQSPLMFAPQVLVILLQRQDDIHIPIPSLIKSPSN
ncbi:unnamed protein product [Eruca vesicaria subsp. sativa]|uniref:Uncharacterized protein n=1 Tax=Eruca vesicaria subsp. sativa TaxID=29727 RepID=A0ABC8JUJ5_ERUVS|nr:unnamed protein product [Eruca vesicaria subsp. sativa]